MRTASSTTGAEHHDAQILQIDTEFLAQRAHQSPVHRC
jgi:hypothetical protein